MPISDNSRGANGKLESHTLHFGLSTIYNLFSFAEEMRKLVNPTKSAEI